MIVSVTFLSLRHPTDRWYSCRANWVSSKSIAIRSARSCPITWRAISHLSSGFSSRGTFRPVITAGLYATVCGTSCACWATKRLSNCPKASASVCTTDCFRSAESSSGSTALSPLVHLLDPYINVPIETCEHRDLFLSLSLRIGITLPRFHECHRAQPAGPSAEPGGHADADADSNRGVADAQTGRLGVSTSSLARVSDGSEPARCIH